MVRNGSITPGATATRAGPRFKPIDALPLGSNGDGKRRRSVAALGRGARGAAPCNQEEACRLLGASRGEVQGGTGRRPRTTPTRSTGGSKEEAGGGGRRRLQGRAGGANSQLPEET
eukprot:11903201-Heterocapsa_arctica.AAC.1